MLGDWSQIEFDYLKNCEWVGTEKIDGTNIRIGWCRGESVKIGGKTDNAQIPAFLVEHLRGLFPDGKMEGVITKSDELVLYGEGFGARIQKGGENYIKDGVGFILFDVRVGDWWLNREDIEDVAHQLTLPIVPIIFSGILDDAINMARTGFDSKWGSFVAEGLVLKPKIELQTRSGYRIVTKIKHQDFKRIA